MRLPLIAGLVLVIVAVAVVGWIATRPEPIHVIIVSMDTARRDHFGYYGYGRRTSPKLDELAKSAAVFDQAIAAVTNTAPSHATVLTGLYPQAHGIVRNRNQLKEGIPTLGQILRGNDYRTAAFISGYTLAKRHTGLDRGFDHYDESDMVRGGREGDKTLKAAMAWLDAHAGQSGSMFLLLHFFDPHYPYSVPPIYLRPFLEPGQRTKHDHLHDLYGKGGDPQDVRDYIRVYDAEILFADEKIGRLVGALKKHGLWDHTLLVFMSDHGETLDDREWFFDHGARVNEEQILIPLLIRFPHDRFAGMRVDSPVHHVDLLPTILDFLDLPEPAALHGRSLLPVLRGEATVEIDRPLFSIARPEPKRMTEVDADLVKAGTVTSVRTWPYKLIEYPTREGKAFQLFDLREDPAEKIDLSESRPQVLEALRIELQRWKETAGDAEKIPVPMLSPEAEKLLEALGYVR